MGSGSSLMDARKQWWNERQTERRDEPSVSVNYFLGPASPTSGGKKAECVWHPYVTSSTTENPQTDSDEESKERWCLIMLL